MANTSYMQTPFRFKLCIEKYMYEIKMLRTESMDESEVLKLKHYYAAVYAFKESSLFQLATFILTYARPQSQHAQMLHQAMDFMLGEEVVHPTRVDYEYLLLLKEYAEAFRESMTNIRDWIIRSALTSPMSPVSPYVDRAIASTLTAIDNKLSLYKKILNVDEHTATPTDAATDDTMAFEVASDETSDVDEPVLTEAPSEPEVVDASPPDPSYETHPSVDPVDVSEEKPTGDQRDDESDN